MDDIEDKGSILVVKIPETQTDSQRTFIVTNNTKLDLLSYYRKYVSLRPPFVSTRRLFLQYQDGECINQVVGTNKIGKIPLLIAHYLELPFPTSFTVHCFRSMSATLLSSVGADISIQQEGTENIPERSDNEHENIKTGYCYNPQDIDADGIVKEPSLYTGNHL